MIFHNYFIFELRISKLLIFDLVTYSRFIKVFLFVVFATKALSHEVFLTAKGAGDFCSQRREVAKFFCYKEYEV